MEHPRQGEVFWANLDPTIGREIRKRRPVLVVSPDEMNRNLATVIAAPITSTHRPWPTRCRISYRGRSRSVALDQIRCLDVGRLGQRLPQSTRSLRCAFCARCSPEVTSREPRGQVLH